MVNTRRSGKIRTEGTDGLLGWDEMEGTTDRMIVER